MCYEKSTPFSCSYSLGERLLADGLLYAMALALLACLNV